MTEGTSQGLFIVVAIVIFGIFVVLAYILFEETLSPALANMFTDASEQATMRLSKNLLENGRFEKPLILSEDSRGNFGWVVRAGNISIDTENKLDNHNSLRIRTTGTNGEIVYRFREMNLDTYDKIKIEFLAKADSDVELQLRLGGKYFRGNNTNRQSAFIGTDLEKHEVIIENLTVSHYREEPAIIFHVPTHKTIWMSDVRVTYFND